MDETQMRLDGNAAGGLLMELFGADVTNSRGQCATCGTIAEFGRQHLYMFPRSPGAVLRCMSCKSVLMVVVRMGDHRRVSMSGVRWMEVAADD